jgi:hypothetical protein
MRYLSADKNDVRAFYAQQITPKMQVPRTAARASKKGARDQKQLMHLFHLPILREERHHVSSDNSHEREDCTNWNHEAEDLHDR